jgi:hypothetical protein
MAEGSAYAVVTGPMVAVLVVGVFVLILRWAYSSKPTTLLSKPTRPGAPDEYGLLVSVAAPASAEEGAYIRDRLEAAGFRVTLAETHSGLHVLVWPADAGRARAALDEVPD